MHKNLIRFFPNNFKIPKIFQKKSRGLFSILDTCGDASSSLFLFELLPLVFLVAISCVWSLNGHPYFVFLLGNSLIRCCFPHPQHWNVLLPLPPPTNLTSFLFALVSMTPFHIPRGWSMLQQPLHIGQVLQQLFVQLYLFFLLFNDSFSLYLLTLQFSSRTPKSSYSIRGTLLFFLMIILIHIVFCSFFIIPSCIFLCVFMHTHLLVMSSINILIQYIVMPTLNLLI